MLNNTVKLSETTQTLYNYNCALNEIARGMFDIRRTTNLNHEEEDALYEHINAIMRPIQDMVREELIKSVTDSVMMSYDSL